MLEKTLRKLRIAARAWQLNRGRDADLRDLRRQSTPSATACPVCNSKCIDVQFQFGTDMFLKSVCDNCEHLFTNWSQTNVEENTSLFGYLQENENISVQAALLEEAAALSRGGRVLDFGTGANIRSIRVARKPTENTDYWACDLYQSDEKKYFSTYDTTCLGTFSAISSYAVIEHLTAPYTSWIHLNRLLRTRRDGKSFMIHAFPSQFHHRLNDWQIVIRSHTCLFSRKSLKLLLKSTGFRLLSADPPRPVGPHSHPVFVFEKIEDK